MTDRYEPPEAKIAEVIAKTGGDPRKLAIAYLRAQKRAREAETAFGLMGDINDLTRSAFTGDIAGAERAVDRASRRVDRHAEVESELRGHGE